MSRYEYRGRLQLPIVVSWQITASDCGIVADYSFRLWYRGRKKMVGLQRYGSMLYLQLRSRGALMLATEKNDVNE